MNKIKHLIEQFYKYAAIPVYPKCKNCGTADPYLPDSGICYKCDDPIMKKEPEPEPEPKKEIIDVRSKKPNLFDNVIKIEARKAGAIPYIGGLNNYMSIDNSIVPINKDDLNSGKIDLYTAFPDADKSVLDKVKLIQSRNSLMLSAVLNNVTLHYETFFSTMNNEFNILVIDATGKKLASEQYDADELKLKIKNKHDFKGAKNAGLPQWFIVFCMVDDDLLPIS